jgi:N-acyl-D-amino-acid deacylase
MIFGAKRLIVTSSLLALALPVMSADYDLVILNGRVMDPETMLDAKLNVGVKDGRIAVITRDAITGDENIDAKGLVVAPGFIDTHFHSMDGLGMKIAARDGVTSVLSLEGGAWNIDAWYKNKEGKWPLNFGAAASHERAREIVLDGMKFDGPVDSITVFDDRTKAGEDGVLGWSVTRPNLEQLNELSKLIDEQLRQGALGVASLTGYARDGITTYELFEMQRASARYGRMFSSHQRFHGNPKNPEAALGFDEMFANAVVLGAPLMVCHNNDWGWWEIEEKLHMARGKGMNMWSEYYPYAAASSEINAEYMKPEIFEGLMGYKYEESVYDPDQDKFLTKDEVLKMQKEDPGHTIVIHLKPRLKWMPYWLKMPHMTVASDAMWVDGGRDAKFPAEKYTGHPRTAGSRGKVLKLARESGVPLMFTLHQLSYWSARHLGDMGLEAMQERGRLQQGMVADITIFDAEKVQDNATFKSGEQGLPTTGIPYVIVSGAVVVKDSKFQYDTFPGQPIRFPMQDKGRFQALSVNKWVKDFSISAPDVHLHVGDEPDRESQKRYEKLGSGAKN